MGNDWIEPWTIYFPKLDKAKGLVLSGLLKDWLWSKLFKAGLQNMKNISHVLHHQNRQYTWDGTVPAPLSEKNYETLCFYKATWLSCIYKEI